MQLALRANLRIRQCATYLLTYLPYLVGTVPTYLGTLPFLPEVPSEIVTGFCAATALLSALAHLLFETTVGAILSTVNGLLV